ncbi:MAG: GNAT family N-acetyltransferase [Rhizobiales bacterium]|nr:GNAT family N-acetyltransferase [Hyphomicrobiales bacterium]
MTQQVVHAVDATPAKRPEPVTIQGRYGRLEKLNAAKHAGALWEAVKGHDQVWTYLFNGPFSERADFDAYIEMFASREDPYAYAILDREGRAVGFATLMEIRPANRVIEVGNILYSPLLQRTPLATEVQYLLARYAFEGLRNRRYEWKCNSLNEPSRRAALRYGFSFEGVFKQHMIVKGRNRDTTWYAMLDHEWPAVKRAFEAWLAPENFDAQGKQKKKLEAFRV